MSSVSLSIEESDVKDMMPCSEYNVLVLGDGSDVDSSKKKSKIIEEILPGVIARKIEKIVPTDYSVSKIEMNVSIQGNLFGQKLSGQVKVTFEPEK